MPGWGRLRRIEAKEREERRRKRNEKRRRGEEAVQMGSRMMAMSGRADWVSSIEQFTPNNASSSF
jgi:TPP-dependent pyruvate/acetoin dehydrogenase alpha subunit